MHAFCQSVIIILRVSALSDQGLVTYTFVSVRNNGEQCLSDCHANVCIINRALKTDSCTGSGDNPNYRPARRYFSFRYRNKKYAECLSNCGKFGEDKEWCFVGRNFKNHSWDYCSTQVLTYNHVSYTTDGGLCINDCRNNTCAVDRYLHVKQCTPSKQPSFIYYTFTILPHFFVDKMAEAFFVCVTRCGKFGLDYEWCFTDEKYTWDYCMSQDLTFTVDGYTTDGLPCLNDCVNNTCAYDDTLQAKECISKNMTAPIYLTKKTRRDYPVCLSKCGKFNHTYDWCYVNYKYAWDFCYPINTTFTKLYYTVDEKPCINDCVIDKCIVDREMNLNDCKTESLVANAPKYFTQRIRKSEVYCNGKCSSAGKQYDWCFVGAIGLDNWDYCYSVDPRYTMIATTADGDACLTNCIDNKCAVNFALDKKNCTRREQPAPQHYTKMERTLYNTCISNCGKFGNERDWCFVTQDFQWDWCLSDLGRRAQPRHAILLLILK